MRIIESRIPATVTRDGWTRGLIMAAAIVYLADIWDPLPIGETLAALLVVLFFCAMPC